jgi:serine/threonine-protein kinase
MQFCPQCGTRFSEAVSFCPHDGSPTQVLNDEPPPDPLIGRVIDGRYRVEKQIGEGGMGVVYLTTHAILGKRMALKVLRGDMAKDAEVVQRFMQEAQSATSIGHANIIDISDFGRLPDGSVYFVMEYLDGASLSHFINAGGSIPVQTAVHVIRQIASALDAAHTRGIVHRDLKPDNVYLVKRGQDPHFVKVLDFGIAKVGGASSKLTRTGMIFGTPHYMSPEQASGQSVDHRTDIYALGIIMYEMFTGKVPFDGDTFMGILSKHMFEPPVPPSQVLGKRLGVIEEVILKSLAKKPDERYGTMAELIEHLNSVQAHGTLELASRFAVIPATSLADALEPKSNTEMRLERRYSSPDGISKHRTPIVLAMLAMLAVVGLGVGATVFWMTGSPNTVSSNATASTTESATPTPTPTAPSVPNVPGVPSVPSAPSIPVAIPVAPTPPAPRTIQIITEPPGAEVVIDNVIVGNTPLPLPTPDDGERALEIRMRGFTTATVRINRQSPDAVRIDLSPIASGGHRRRPPSAEAAATEPSPPPTPTPPVSHTRPSSEVVDPWGQ